MKTSNKILTGFALAVFSMPVISAFIIKSKVRKEEYTVVSENQGYLHGGPNPKPLPDGNYSVIKFNGSLGQASCSLYGAMGNEGLYAGKNKLGDSIALHCANDTLYVNTVLMKREGDQKYYEGIYFQLYVKSAKSIIISSSHVTLSEPASINEDLSIKLSTGSSLAIVNDRSTTKRAKRLQIDADGGEVRVFNKDAAETIALNLRGTGTLELNDYAFPVTGYIGDSVKVSGSWRALKQLSK